MHVNKREEAFDSVGALDRVCGDIDLLLDLSEMLRTQSNESIAAMLECINAANFSDLSHKAHSLKSALGNLGAQTAYSTAQKLEVAAENQASSEAESLILILSENINEFWQAFSDFCSAQGKQI